MSCVLHLYRPIIYIYIYIPIYMYIYISFHYVCVFVFRIIIIQTMSHEFSHVVRDIWHIHHAYKHYAYITSSRKYLLDHVVLVQWVSIVWSNKPRLYNNTVLLNAFSFIHGDENNPRVYSMHLMDNWHTFRLSCRISFQRSSVKHIGHSTLPLVPWGNGLSGRPQYLNQNRINFRKVQQ